MLVNEAGKLTGIFTDSDLARLFERRRDPELDYPIRQVMTVNPLTVSIGSRIGDAVTIMGQRKISELPVVDEEGEPVGLIDITDLVGLFPSDGKTPAGARAEPEQKPACRVVYEPDEAEAT